MIVSNHLSYLDILFYGAITPCVFVAKTEVRGWPMLGLLASLGGTVFIDRSSTVSAGAAVERIGHLLKSGVTILIFPEGTSSDGSNVLKFYPSLFEPAVRSAAPVTVATIGYSAAPGTPERDLCYYGDISFVPHLLQTLPLAEVAATLRFSGSPRVFNHRKDAAMAAWHEASELRRLPAGPANEPSMGVPR